MDHIIIQHQQSGMMEAGQMLIHEGYSELKMLEFLEAIRNGVIMTPSNAPMVLGEAGGLIDNCLGRLVMLGGIFEYTIQQDKVLRCIRIRVVYSDGFHDTTLALDFSQEAIAFGVKMKLYRFIDKRTEEIIKNLYES